MSIILEALKKSENQRQRQSGPGFATVPERAAHGRRSVWPLMVVVLLAINTVVLVVFLMRGDDTPVPAPVGSTARTGTDQVAEDTGDRQLPAARQTRSEPDRPAAARLAPASASAEAPGLSAPSDAVTRAPAGQRDVRSLADEAARPTDTARDPAPPAAATTAAASSPPISRPSAAPSAGSSSNAAALPTATELFLKGELTGPPLNLDLHVYYPEPGRRVVFVNGRKYREGERLSSGPTIREIVPEGVVLTDGVRNFLLQAE